MRFCNATGVLRIRNCPRSGLGVTVSVADHSLCKRETIEGGSLNESTVRAPDSDGASRGVAFGRLSATITQPVILTVVARIAAMCNLVMGAQPAADRKHKCWLPS